MNTWFESNYKQIAKLLIAVLFLIPLGIAGYSLIYQELNKNREAVVNQNNEFAEYAARFLNGYLADYKRTLQNIAQSSVLAQGDPEEIKELFERFNLIRPEPILFWFTDSQGNLLVKYPDKDSNKSIKDMDFFQESMGGRNCAYGPYVGRVSGIEVVVISVPYYHNGQIEGVIGVSIPLYELDQRLSLIQRGDECYLALVNIQGEVLCHPNLAEFRKDFSFEDCPLSKALLLDHQREGYYYYGRSSSYGENLNSFVKLTEAPWVIISVQPMESLESQLSGILGHSLAILIIVGVLVGFIIHYLLLLRDMKNIEKVKQTEKLAVVGELAAGIAHEIRNPLTSIKGFVQLMEMKKGKDIPSYYYETMLDELERIEEIVGEMVVLAKPAPSQKTLVDLKSLIQDTINLMTPQAEMREITLRAELPLDLLPVEVVKNQIKQVLINLIKNAIEAMEDRPGGEILIKVESQSQSVTIAVMDNGMGIPEKDLKKLGMPFFSTKETGTGLGLMTSYRIIQNHGGEITVVSEPEVGVGTVFTITLPRN